ncbi:MAG: glutamine-hydrolyzing GMP synthase, partial [Candidatus Altarchaeaceae archaeon]
MDKIVVLDFGGQYCHLISRRIRELNVYCEILPGNVKVEILEEMIKNENLKGIILSGGAMSVYDENSIKCDKEIFNLNIPILGICYGHQLIAYLNNGLVEKGEKGEFGITKCKILKESLLFSGIDNEFNVWMSHYDIVKKIPDEFEIIAETENCKIAAFENKNKKIFGVQFHPEVVHTENGIKILENFIKITNSKREWRTENLIQEIIQEAKEI